MYSTKYLRDEWQAKSDDHLLAQQTLNHAVFNSPMKKKNSKENLADGLRPADLVSLQDHMGVCVEYAPSFTLAEYASQNILKNLPVTKAQLHAKLL